MVEPIKIIIADDHPLFRAGVGKTLTDIADCEVVAECGSGSEALEAVRDQRPDIILLDISMPGGGIEAARQITASFPDVKVIMLTVSERTDDVKEALTAGASGYVVKGIAGEAFANVIKSVHSGNVYVTPGMAAAPDVGSNARDTDKNADEFPTLTAREKQVLMEVAQGLSNKEIGETLSLTERSVKRYMTSILRKLNVRNRTEAALKARNLSIASHPTSDPAS